MYFLALPWMIIKLKIFFFILSFTFGHTSGFIDIRFVVWYSGVLIYIYLMCSCRFRNFNFLLSYSSLLKYSSCLKWPPIFCLKIWNLSCCCWYIGCCAEYLTCVTLIDDLGLRPLPWNPDHSFCLFAVVFATSRCIICWWIWAITFSLNRPPSLTSRNVHVVLDQLPAKCV